MRQVDDSAAGMTQHMRESAQLPTRGNSASTVTIGFANPGKNGCADFDGTVNFAPVLMPEVGLNAVSKALGLDLIALTAPRLREDVVRLPGGLLGVHCRGGPSYASTAVAWRRHMGAEIGVLENLVVFVACGAK